MNIDLSNTKQIYSRFQDEYSRWLYEKRVMYSITGDNAYVDDIMRSLIDSDQIDELMTKAKTVSDRLVIRGAGNDYWILKRLYPELEFKIFVDNDLTKQGHMIDGKSVISPNEFYDRYSDHYILVNSTAANGEICRELKDHGIPDEQVLNLARCYEQICDRQYFEKDFMKCEAGEVFVDGGCYDGRTIRQFIQWCNGKYEKVYSFEPDPNNYVLAKKRLEEEGLWDVELINKGLWNESTELNFIDNGTQGAMISQEGQNTIRTATIDETVNAGKVTFIKLDVEGAEYNAILGAAETIIKYKPKLAISIYHKPEDIFELPELILSLCGDYRFYLRHYQLSRYETILYAVI